MADTNKPLISMTDCWHVGVVVRDMDRAIEVYSKVFDWGPWDRWYVKWPGTATLRGKPASYEGPRAWLKLGPILFEVGETHGEAVHAEFLESHGGGLHHLAFYVDDIEDAIARLDKLGIPILQSGKDKNGKYNFIYFSTEELTGSNIIIELNPRPSK